MKSLLEGVDIANDVMMSAQANPGPFIIVEGATEWDIFESFRDPSCQIQIAHGKAIVLQAIDILLQRGFNRALGLVDSDFWNVDGIAPPNSHIVATDHHDIEVMLLASPALQKLLNRTASQEKLAQFRAKIGISIPEWLANQAFPVGSLLHLSIQKKWRLCFSELRFSRFVSKDSLELVVSDMVSHVFSQSRDPACKRSDVDDKFPTTPKSYAEALQVCRGEDAIEILGIGLTKTLGTQRHNETTRAKLVDQLVLAYDSRHFQKSQVYSAMKSWEAAQGCRLLSF